MREILMWTDGLRLMLIPIPITTSWQSTNWLGLWWIHYDVLPSVRTFKQDKYCHANEIYWHNNYHNTMTMQHQWPHTWTTVSRWTLKIDNKFTISDNNISTTRRLSVHSTQLNCIVRPHLSYSQKSNTIQYARLFPHKMLGLLHNGTLRLCEYNISHSVYPNKAAATNITILLLLGNKKKM